MAARTPVTLHVEQYNGGASVPVEEFNAWFSRFVLPSGAHADATTLATINELCSGHQMGEIHTPSESITATDVPWVCVGIDVADWRLKCYAAVRLDIPSRTLVIDLLCVHPMWRRLGTGNQFYTKTMEMLTPQIKNHLNGLCSIFTISVQSTFDYPSYLHALASCSVLKYDKGGRAASFSVDKDRLVVMLTGACQFWRRMGFDHYKLIFAPLGRDTPTTAINPILLMWMEEEI